MFVPTIVTVIRVVAIGPAVVLDVVDGIGMPTTRPEITAPVDAPPARGEVGESSEVDPHPIEAATKSVITGSDKACVTSPSVICPARREWTGAKNAPIDARQLA
jgi:hypothetical protein